MSWWNMKMTVILIVVIVLWMTPKGFEKSPEELEQQEYLEETWRLAIL